jgi:hypothetical protein
MNGPAGADIEWKDIAAPALEVVVLVELARAARALAHKEGCAQKRCRKSAGCSLAGSFAGLPVYH